MFNAFIVKLTNACNLACPYCYYMVDAPRKGQLVSETVLPQLFLEISRHCNASRQLRFYWHGGEPLLIGKDRFRGIIETQRSILADYKIVNGLQTNGVKLDEEWIELFKEFGVGLGISLDGTQAGHDAFRVDHKGRGTYTRVAEKAQLALRSGLDPMCLVVVNPTEDGAVAFENLTSMGFRRLDFLLPMANWDSYNERAAVGCGNYLVDAFHAWLNLGDQQIHVKLFESMIKAVTGQIPGCCMFHNSCHTILTIEPNGDIALCDDLKPVGDHVYRTGLNITRDSLPVIRRAVDASFQDHAINAGRATRALGDVTQNWCPATRYSSDAGFTKPSVDAIPLGMLKHEVMQALEGIGIDQFHLHPHVMTPQ